MTKMGSYLMAMRHHLRESVVIPVLCRHCFSMHAATVGNLRRSSEFPCDKCNKPIDLTSAKYRAYLRQFEEAVALIDSTTYEDLRRGPDTPQITPNREV
jgi:hypothetical protein